MSYSIDGGNIEIEPGKDLSRSVNFAEHGPVPVYVTGKNGEILGAGRKVGLLHLYREDGTRFTRRIISVDDPQSPDGEVEMLDSECFFYRYV